MRRPIHLGQLGAAKSSGALRGRPAPSSSGAAPCASAVGQPLPSSRLWLEGGLCVGLANWNPALPAGHVVWPFFSNTLTVTELPCAFAGHAPPLSPQGAGRLSRGHAPLGFPASSTLLQPCSPVHLARWPAARAGGGGAPGGLNWQRRGFYTTGVCECRRQGRCILGHFRTCWPACVSPKTFKPCRSGAMLERTSPHTWHFLSCCTFECVFFAAKRALGHAALAWGPTTPRGHPRTTQLRVLYAR